jgi:glycosyltransferase A (GT-A) superfamily protein (DUF2064 family)
MSGATVAVIAKSPAPGAVKTRLSPPCTPAQAAGLAEAALRDTLAAVLATPVTRRVVVLAGQPGSWLPPGIDVVPQRGRGLDERLAHAFTDIGGPALIVGMDTPQVTPQLLSTGVRWLSHSAAVLGPALDGGYWAIGLRAPDERALVGVPMSRTFTCAAQRRRLADLRLPVVELPALMDVDDFTDARAVAAGMSPQSAFRVAVEGLALVERAA